MWCTCVLPLQLYRDITSVLFCRLINVDILLLFLILFIRYKAEIKDNRHIVDAINTCIRSLQPYRDITCVLLCRLINVDILLLLLRSSGDRGVKLLACGARSPRFDSPPRHLNFRDWLSPASMSRYD